ncbi:hypothetical protein JCM3775_006058 [Rhodotorula graminis]
MAAAAQGPFKLKLTLGGGPQGPSATAAPLHPAHPAHAHHPPPATGHPPAPHPPSAAYAPPPSTSSPQPHRQPPPPPPGAPQHYAHQPAHYPPQHAPHLPQYHQPPVADDHGDRVSANKYRKLKQLHLDAVASRDDAHLALYRAQKLIARLRDDKSSLLDRVVELELAAGLTSADVAHLRDQALRSERELAFPLLHPPTPLSMADRARPRPVLTTSTDLANDQYNAPIGPAPLPKTLAPRQRSHHLRTAVAAQKLRDDYDAQRVAHGLPRPAFPAVAVLGLEGSSIALNVERAMSGVELVPAAEVAAAARAGKRPRESSSGVSGGAAARPRGRARRSSFSQPTAAAAASAAGAVDAPTYNNLPNPFAAVGAVPLGSTMARNNAEAIAAAGPSDAHASAVAAAAGAAAPEASVEPDSVMDDAASVGSGEHGEGEGFLDEDGGDYKPAARRAGARKSDTGAAGDGKLFKPKKVKQHNLTTGTFSIPPIARNPDGSVRLPASVGIMQIKSLGTVDPREGFHTERYIFPVGFEATRRYPSMVNRTGTADYTCRITDGGDGNARFELYPSDQPGVVISSGTPTGAWSQVVKATNKLRERNHSNSVSGPDYYGLSHNVVKAMIQELPGADSVPGYIWHHFVEDAAQARAPPGGAAGGKKAAAAASRRKSRGGGAGAGNDGYDQMSPGASGEIAVDDGGYGLDTGYDHDEYGSPDGYAPGTAGDYQVQPNSSLQHLLASANAAPPANPYDIPTSMPGSSALDVGAGVGAGGAIDPMFNLAGAGSAAFDPYAVGGQAIIDPAFADASTYAYPMQPGGQPVEYPSSEAESD